jgi:hypothetical protein
MGGLNNIVDNVLLAIGILLLSFLWFSFPGVPVSEEQLYTNYYPSEIHVNSSSKWTYLRPSKSLSARDVIRIQLKALQENDKRDSGVITVFNFSSPVSRVSMGPINNFRIMVRDPAYSSMLNFKSYKTGHLIITDNTAYQIVVLQNTEGQQTAYMFMLAKQKKGNYKDCWMTVGVVRLDNNRPTFII